MPKPKIAIYVKENVDLTKYGFKQIQINYYERRKWLFVNERYLTDVEKLTSETVKNYFKNWTQNDGSYGKCIIVIFKDRWNNNKEIYRGNNYEEFRKICIK